MTYLYNIGDYVHKKTKDGRKLYFAGVDRILNCNGIPCVFLTTEKNDLSNTGFWFRWNPDGIIK